ncbi:MAG: alpha/beta hydrolase [Firmicutes bacterium]|nr:alpha/beta hydrolase [Bacillota bacterium]
MLKKRKQHNLKLLIIALVVGLTCTLFASCGKGANSYMYETETFFLENDRDSYIYGELVMPVTDEECPLVFIAHGFKGTRNSGGAKELSQRLAEAGIAAVRIDFNGYTEESLKSSRTNRYTLSDMQSDAVITINYVIENYDIDIERLGVYGRSMGGRVAMMLANENVGEFDFKAMSLIAPAGDEEAMIYYMGGQEKWDDMKVTALEDGYCPKQGLELTYDWFTDFEEYDPSKTGYKFGDKPVMLYYNTLDTVVRPVTSLACAAAYENVETHEVTTEDGHGYEMGYKESELKDEIMTKIVGFFAENLEV